MKTSSLAFLSFFVPLISAIAVPEATVSYPEGVRAVIVTEVDYPGAAPAGIEKRDAPSLGKRAVHGVYLCNRAYFQNPYCVKIWSDHNVCVPLGSDLEDQVSSVGPDQGAYCRFYYDRGCVDNDGRRHFDTQYPGVDNLQFFGNGDANDKISSYQCWDA